MSAWSALRSLAGTAWRLRSDDVRGGTLSGTVCSHGIDSTSPQVSRYPTRNTTAVQVTGDVSGQVVNLTAIPTHLCGLMRSSLR